MTRKDFLKTLGAIVVGWFGFKFKIFEIKPTYGDPWSKIALPLVRRTFGQLASKEMLSVKPMAYPEGIVYWMDHTYKSNTI